MNEHIKAEITRLLLERVAIGEAKGKQFTLITTAENLNAILEGAIKAGYGHLHPAWALLLYLQRN